MKREWIITFMVILVTGVLIVLATTSMFLSFAKDYPLLSSFIKFFLLASIGDIIGQKLQTKLWKLPNNIALKAIVWGFIGIVIYLMFQVYPSGVTLLQTNKILPFEGNTFFFAFFVSLIMNYTFAPTMMAVHRISDTYLNERALGHHLSFIETVNQIDWGKFFQFTLLRTIPLFWIPAHTITFLLPSEYRIVFAAVLGIVLGILLSFTNRPKKEN